MAARRLAKMDIGDRFVGTNTRMVTPTELDMFCNITGMRGDIFLSNEAAKSLGMKSRVLPGAMSLAILFSLLEEFLQGAIFVGLRNLKLLAPIFPCDRLRAEGEILAKKETSKGDRIVVTYSWVLRNQDEVAVAQGENT